MKRSRDSRRYHREWMRAYRAGKPSPVLKRGGKGTVGILGIRVRWNVLKLVSK
jgi:hypothetical protein